MARRYTQTTLDDFVRTAVEAAAEQRSSENVAAATCSYRSADTSIGALEPSEWRDEACGCVQVCNKKCRNRLRRIECSPGTSSKGGECFNRPWASYDLARSELDVRYTGEKGWGAFALEMIEEYSLVREYVGEIIDGEEKQRREANFPSVYIMAYGSNKYIDARHARNIPQFFNHSCQANCVAEEWTVKGKYRIGIVATRQIFPGEEITFNYGSLFNFNECKCEVCITRRSSSSC